MRRVVACAVMQVAVCAAAAMAATPTEEAMMAAEGAVGLPDRYVLEGVPRVGFYPKQSTSSPEDDQLPACLRAWLQFMGDDEDMKRLSAIKGDAFASWNDEAATALATSAVARAMGERRQLNAWTTSTRRLRAKENTRSILRKVLTSRPANTTGTPSPSNADRRSLAVAANDATDTSAPKWCFRRLAQATNCFSAPPSPRVDMRNSILTVVSLG